MKTVAQIRRERLAELIQVHGSYAALNAKLDLHARDATLNQIANALPNSKSGTPRAMGPTLARRIERVLGKPTGWMDTDGQSADWPFPAVDRERYDRLSPADQAFVQRQVNMALADCESRDPPAGATRATVHEPRKRYRVA